MHPVPNEVEIPTEKISEVLERSAVPGFTGSVTVHIRLLETAAHEVEFRFERKTVLQLQKPQDPEFPHVTNARVASVRRALAENARLFRLRASITGVMANFKDGMLTGMTGMEVE
jgi:hypothetical protein